MGRLQYVQSVGGSDISENWINDDDLIVKMDEEDRMDDDLIVKMDEEDKAVQGTPNLEYFVKVHHIKSDGGLQYIGYTGNEFKRNDELYYTRMEQ